MYFDHVKLPDIKLERVTKEDGKRYYVTPEGNRYTSVTTMLSHFSQDAIKEWRKKVGYDEANKISKRASGRGTRLHTLCEKYLMNEDAKIDHPLDLQLFKTILPHLDEINNIHLLEKYLYSDYLRLAGTVDCVAEYRGKLNIIDFKTSSKLKKEEWIEGYFIQACAYAIMFEERYKIPVPRITIIIATEEDGAQVFHKRRDDYADLLLEYRDIYERANK